MISISVHRIRLLFVCCISIAGVQGSAMASISVSDEGDLLINPVSTFVSTFALCGLEIVIGKPVNAMLRGAGRHRRHAVLRASRAEHHALRMQHLPVQV
jgi:hypothetical protein